MNLKNFFINPFANLRVGFSKFRKFCEIHIQRVTAQNVNGKYDGMLAKTNAAYTDYFGTTSDEDTKLSEQQSLTISTNDVVEEFKDTMKQKEGTIRGNWAVNSPVYQEFFPHGLTEYSRATFENVETLMKRMVTASQAHIDVLGQPFVDLFTGILDRYTGTRKNQLKKIGEVKDNRVKSVELREVLEDQLFENLLTLALEYKNNPDAGIAFFDQSFLKSSSSKDDDGDVTPPVQ